MKTRHAQRLLGWMLVLVLLLGAQVNAQDEGAAPMPEEPPGAISTVDAEPLNIGLAISNVVLALVVIALLFDRRQALRLLADSTPPGTIEKHGEQLARYFETNRAQWDNVLAPVVRRVAGFGADELRGYQAGAPGKPGGTSTGTGA